MKKEKIGRTFGKETVRSWEIINPFFYCRKRKEIKRKTKRKDKKENMAVKRKKERKKERKKIWTWKKRIGERF